MKFDAQGLVVSILAVTFGLYLTYTIVNEQYVLWFLPFLVLAFPNTRALKLGAIAMNGVAFAYAFLQYGMYYGVFLSPTLDSKVAPLNAWISHALSGLEDTPLGTGLVGELSLAFSIITLACLTFVLFHATRTNRKPETPRV